MFPLIKLVVAFTRSQPPHSRPKPDGNPSFHFCWSLFLCFLPKTCTSDKRNMVHSLPHELKHLKPELNESPSEPPSLPAQKLPPQDMNQSLAPIPKEGKERRLIYLSFPSKKTRVISTQTREAKAIIRRAPAHINLITAKSDSLSSQMQTYVYEFACTYRIYIYRIYSS